MITFFKSNKKPDFIGDIHGHLPDLERLFIKLGYEKIEDIYVHSERIPVFLGDYINRGPDILGVLKLVRDMQLSGNAYALMGNHEFNFLAYHFKDEQNIPFRPNTERYYGYIRETKDPLEKHNLLETYLEWMSNLPLIIKSDSFNAVHAQWNEILELELKKSGIEKLDQDGMRKIHLNSSLLESVSSVVKGSEHKITDFFIDKYNFDFRQPFERIVWWKNSRSNKIMDWLDVDPINHPILIDRSDFSNIEDYDDANKPTFFGHYWLDPKNIGIISQNLCCLDYSVAKGGVIGAYSFDGESTLSNHKIVHS